MTLTIRRAVPEDAADLTRIAYLSKQSNGYDDAFMAACADELRITPKDITDDMIWVAETNQPLGCVTLVLNTETRSGQVSSFFIHPESKRQGVGKALWRVVLIAAREQKLQRLHLDADPAAVPFYEAMGFTTVGQKPSGSVPGRFLPLMELHLS